MEGTETAGAEREETSRDTLTDLVIVKKS